MLEMIIKDGIIIDGSGAPGSAGDVGVRAGRIAMIGDCSGKNAERVLDARGRVVTPGFIDLHTHCTANPNINYLQQGVTLVVTGNCGFSDLDVQTVNDRCKAGEAGPNIATLIGHNTIRRHVIGSDDRTPTPEEMDAMRDIVNLAMKRGAMGLSTGLAYVPGTFTQPEEIIELARTVSRHGGYYASHMRNESSRVLDSVAETIRVGRESGLPAHVSHHKVAGTRFHGYSGKTLGLIESARGEGLDVTLDQYPYTASCGRIGLLLPEWAQAGGGDAVAARMADPVLARRMQRHIREQIEKRYGGAPSRIVIASCSSDASLQGKTIAQIAAERNRGSSLDEAAETIMEIARLQNPADAGVMCVYHSMSEEDVRRIMAYPHTSIASDGWGPDRAMGHPHPRSFGTFPRVLGRYRRDVGLFTLEEAVRKMTSLPAARLGLADRGVLKEGAAADIVIFDPDAIADTATFDDPMRYPDGIDYVVVNGVIAIDHGEHTGALPGRFVPKPT